MKQALAVAQDANEQLEKIRKDRWYPSFHIAAPAGWINDPNGLSCFGGHYRVFFQHHPFSSEWGPMHWGQVSSKDLVTWRREPIALAPSLEADAGGVYSGSALEVDGILHAYYTGNRWVNPENRDEGNIQVQCLATSTDGVAFKKQGVLIDEVGLANFRDPKVFAHEGTYYMVLGATSSQNRGQVHLYSSVDALSWSFKEVLYEDPREDVFMLECPDLFPLGDYWVLVFCPERPAPTGYTNRNTHNAGYLVGHWLPETGFEALSDYCHLDWGANFYAPQTFVAPDGRRLAFGWMGSFSIPVASRAEDNWAGQLTVPRELTLTEHLVLRSAPVAELAALRQGTQDFSTFTLGLNETKVLAEDIGPCEIELEVDLAATDSERVGLEVMRTPDSAHTFLGYDAQADRVFIDRRLSGNGDRSYRSAPYPGGKKLSLRILVDRGSVEVFVNGGLISVSSLAFPAEGARGLRLVAESGSIAVTSLKLHTLRSIWQETEVQEGVM